MKILITGGAGFLGSWLCDKLYEQGHTLLVLDDLSTGSLANIEHLLNKPNFDFIHHDISHPVQIGYVDEIYNLACPASPQHYQIDPVKTIKTCVLGAINMLDLALKYNAKILQTSTSEIYGNPLEHPQSETYWGNVNPIGPRSCYDEGKRSAETLFYDYHRQYKVNIRVARIFNTYGPKMSKNDGRVISNFINQALEDKPITIYGQGNQTRSFCYVNDLIDGLVKLQQSSLTCPINLGNPTEKTIIEIAQTIVGMTNSKSQIVYKDLPADDPERRRPNIQRAKDYLQWQAQTDLPTGLRATIDFFKRTP